MAQHSDVIQRIRRLNPRRFEQIANAAVHEFAHAGFEKTRIDTVAVKAGQF